MTPGTASAPDARADPPQLDLVVVGMGYVGLPLAAAASEAGLSVAGYDISTTVTARINSGDPGIPDVAAAQLANMLDRGFSATSDPAVLGTAETIVICVPTGLDAQGKPDLAAVRAATRTVARHLRPGVLVVLESTSFPGTTEEVVRPILERRGLLAGTDFFLGYSPERIDPGNHAFDFRSTPKIVSGHTVLCAKQCAEFYRALVNSVVLAKGIREAELAKLLENTYRYVNIALVNQLAQYCERMAIDVWEVLRCASTKPFGFTAFSPGPGAGGHCIPVDPQYLLDSAERAGAGMSVVRAAREVDRGMPGYVVDRVVRTLSRAEILPENAEILLLGVAYKPGVPDTRESRAVPIAAGLHALGARVRYHDPLAGRVPALEEFAHPVRELEAALSAADLTLLLVGHDCYRKPDLPEQAQRLFDATGLVLGEEVERL